MLVFFKPVQLKKGILLRTRKFGQVIQGSDVAHENETLPLIFF